MLETLKAVKPYQCKMIFLDQGHIECLASNRASTGRAWMPSHSTRPAATSVQQPNFAARHVAHLLDRWGRPSMSNPSG